MKTPRRLTYTTTASTSFCSSDGAGRPTLTKRNTPQIVRAECSNVIFIVLGGTLLGSGISQARVGLRLESLEIWPGRTHLLRHEICTWRIKTAVARWTAEQVFKSRACYEVLRGRRHETCHFAFCYHPFYPLPFNCFYLESFLRPDSIFGR